MPYGSPHGSVPLWIGHRKSEYWDFDSATDTTMPDVAIGDVTANHWTLQGATLVREGADGSAGSFDGADPATAANDTEIRKNDSFTLSAWINPAPVNTETFRHNILSEKVARLMITVQHQVYKRDDRSQTFGEH